MEGELQGTKPTFVTKGPGVRHTFLIGVVFLVACGSPAEVADLPEEPDVDQTGFPGIVQEHLSTMLKKVRKKPHDTKTNGRMGMTLHTYLLLEPAAVYYHRSRLLCPECFQWAHLHGLVLMELGHYPEATQAFEHALDRRPKDFWTRLRLAQLRVRADDLRSARLLYEAIVDDHRNNAEAHSELGQVLLQLGETELAAEKLERAVVLEPQLSAAHYSLALAYRKAGEPDRAEKHMALFEEYREHARPSADPLVIEVGRLNRTDRPRTARAKQLIKEGRISEAIAELEHAVEQDPHSVASHTALIGLHGRAGNQQKQPITTRERLN